VTVVLSTNIDPQAIYSAHVTKLLTGDKVDGHVVLEISMFGCERSLPDSARSISRPVVNFWGNVLRIVEFAFGMSPFLAQVERTGSV